MSRVLVPLACGFEEIEAVTIVDILRRGDLEVVVASLDENLLVEGAHRLSIQADRELESVNVDSIDMIVLPGGWGGTKALADDARVQSILKTMDRDGKLIGAICAAPYALDKAGVLKNKFTCYPSVENEIATKGYLYDGGNCIEDGNILTSKGPATAMEFALEIVKKLKGEAKYMELKKALLVL